MTALPLPVRDVTELVKDQQQGLAAWRRDLARRLERDPETEPDREAQMDARRRLAGLHRIRSAVAACEESRSNGLVASEDRLRAVIVHRSTWLRARLAEELQRLGIQVVGEGEDGAVAVAMALVDQPELLILEDRLPWVTPLEVVEEVHKYAPNTVVVVQIEDSVEAEEMVAAGATAVFSRTVHPDELSAACADLVAGGLQRTA